MPPVAFRSITWNLRETALLSMVIPRSCSSSRLSRYLILPTILDDMMLFDAKRASIRVVFPWSTCPSVVIMRIWAGSGASIPNGPESTELRVLKRLHVTTSGPPWQISSNANHPRSMVISMTRREPRNGERKKTWGESASTGGGNLSITFKLLTTIQMTTICGWRRISTWTVKR